MYLKKKIFVIFLQICSLILTHQYMITKSLGTSGNDYCGYIAIDQIGNIFVTGRTIGNLNEAINNGSYDAFLVKFDSYGSIMD